MPHPARHRLARSWAAVVAASLLAGAVLLSPGPAAAALPDCFAVDFQQACASPVGLDFTDTGLCDFPVQVHVTGAISYRPFYANDGSSTITSDELHRRFRATIVNTATDRSFADSADFNTVATYLPDGSADVRITGLLHNAQVDTGERLLHQAGNHSLLLDSNGDVIEEVYHGNWQPEAAFPGQICPILAQPL